MNTACLRNHFDEFTRFSGYKAVKRSKIISPFFQNEFNISGAHQYLIPVLLSNDKINIQKISVRDLCLRKADSDVIGVSLTHLLLFEMAIFGEFGYFCDAMESQQLLLGLLIDYFTDLGLDKNKLLFTICAGGTYLNRQMQADFKSNKILNQLGIYQENIVLTEGRRNFILSRGIDRSAGYNIEVFYPKKKQWVEIASMNIYEFLFKGDYLEETVNKGLGCGIGLNRINYVLGDKESIYEIEPFAEILDGLLYLFSANKKSMELVQIKIFRAIELSKALIIIISDGYTLGNVKKTYSKVMKSYVAKICSELSFLNINPASFFKSFVLPIKNYYKDYTIITDSDLEYLFAIIFSAIGKK